MSALDFVWLAARQGGAMLRAMETRRQLAAMDARMLADIGLSRADALREADRAPWDMGAPPSQTARPELRLVTRRA